MRHLRGERLFGQQSLSENLLQQYLATLFPLISTEI